MVLITLLRLQHPQILFGGCSMSIAIPEANSDKSEASEETSTLEPTFETTLHCTPVNLYEIVDKRESENASCLFVRNHLGKDFVIKLLHKYEDSRYSLKKLDERQRCQLEALQSNRKFAPQVYFGMARLYDRDDHRISISEIMHDPTDADIDPNIEYVLLMEKLPDDRRLDCLLQTQNEEMLWQYIQLLTDYVIRIHTYKYLAAPPPSQGNGMQWGSCEQLDVKLEHNFGLLDLMLALDKDRHNVCTSLKGTLKRVFMGKSQYREYFEQRVHEQCIKHCHGDLKAPNIWILPNCCEPGTEPWKGVWLLDAIDFNPSYRNIDILSDFALLVIDIQARTKSIKLADKMIKYYLKHTNQQNEAAKAVLEYYLVEKAIVGASVSIVYDHLTELGSSYLEVAQMRAKNLKHRLNTLRDDTFNAMPAI